ncbi:hypothetical protein JCM1393_25380 [Clostridium carnis]
MFIVNCNLRKQLGMGRLLQADGGDGTGANGGEGSQDGGEGSKNEEDPEEKTFTQADVDKLIQERVAREKRGQLSKEELKAYNEWKESQKTEEEKKNEALTNAEKARLAAEEKATALEAKVTCLSKGVIATSVDDVVTLAKAMVTEEVTIEQAIDKVLEKYPSFKGEQQQQQEENKGFKIGAGAAQTKNNVNDALSRVFGNK